MAIDHKLRVAIPVNAPSPSAVNHYLGRIKREVKENNALQEKASEAGIEFLVELRLDYMFQDQEAIHNPREVLSLVRELVNASPYQCIVTNRHESESGPDPKAGFKGSEEDRIVYLQEALRMGISWGVAAVDFEYALFKPEYLKDSGAVPENLPMITISGHNFKNSDRNDKVFQEIRSGTRAIDPEELIIKIATKGKTERDHLEMLALNTVGGVDVPYFIGICMGDNPITRVLGPVYGGWGTFASLDTSGSTAKGQLDVGKMVDRLVRAQKLYREGKLELPRTAEQMNQYRELLEI